MGLAKQNEELFVQDRRSRSSCRASSQALYLVQRIRDEAHRFAITYHRQVRARRVCRAPSTRSRHRPEAQEGAAEEVRLVARSARRRGGDRQHPRLHARAGGKVKE